MTILTDGWRGNPERGIHEYESSYGEELGAEAKQSWMEGPTAQSTGIDELARARGESPPIEGGLAVAERVMPGMPGAIAGALRSYKHASEWLGNYGQEIAPSRDVPMPEARARIKQAGLEKDLPNLGEQDTIREAALNIMIQRATARKEREATISRGPGGFMAGALSVGTSFLVPAADPLNIAAAFIPVVGEARYAKLMADFGTNIAARAGIRFGAGAATGGAFTAAMQPLEAYAHTQEGRDFSMGEALRNVMYGAGTFGLLHVGAGGFADVFRSVRKTPQFPFGKTARGQPDTLSGITPAEYEAFKAKATPEELNSIFEMPQEQRAQVVRERLGTAPAKAVAAPGAPAEAPQPAAEPSAPAEPPQRPVSEPVATLQGQRQAIHDEVMQGLRDAGRSAEEADADAALVAAHYLTRARRLGEDALELYRKDNVAVTGPNVPGIYAGDRTFEQQRRGEPQGDDLFAQREAEGQMEIPGAQRIGEGELAQRRADEPLKSKVAQKDMDVGLFGDESKQKSFFQSDPFYSAVERAVSDLKQTRASPDQWLATIKNAKGVKAEELEWLGLEDWLKEQKGPITKDQIADYIRANRIEVKEVEKGGASFDYDEVVKSAETNPDGLVQKLIDAGLPQRDAETRLQGILDRDHHLTATTADFLRREGDKDQTKFASYQLPGGENYRELLLALPQKMEPSGRFVVTDGTPTFNMAANTREEARDILNNLQRSSARPLTIREDMMPSRDANFTGSHWDEPNVLAHVRFNDRTIDGKKTLFIEEIQSDWHQKGRKQGYENAEARNAIEARRDAIVNDALGFLNSVYPGLNTAGQNPRFLGNQIHLVYSNNRVIEQSQTQGMHWGRHLTAEERRRAEQLIGRLDDVEHAATSQNRVPDAPFKTTWPELSLKRMIRYAAEHGYEQVAWTSGKTQAERYDLGHQIESIESSPPEAGKYRITIYPKGYEANRERGAPAGWGGNNDQSHTYEKTAGELTEFVGKDLADKIVAHHEPHDERYFGHKVWSGIDLRVGEGMTPFYDKMLPAAANKLVKKYGGKVGLGEIDARSTEGPPSWESVGTDTKRPGSATESVHTLNITPALREAAMSEGFPLFQRGAEGEPRGRITFAENATIINLFEKADRSTFLHEGGHLFLENLLKDAGREDAPQGIKDDFATVLRWLNVDKADDIKVAQHETFARGFEQYLREGNAPSSALARVFEQFKEWLTAIYQSLSALGRPINQDIRGVMDRMLASDEEIAARSGPSPLDIITNLPPRAKEDAHRIGIAQMIRGEPIEVAQAIEAGAAKDPRIAEAVNGHEPVAAPESEEGIVTRHVTAPVARGPRARPAETWSLLEFLAAHGGLSPDDHLIGDVKSSIGKDNKFVPGFGSLIRKGGMKLEDALQAAKEANYFFDAGDVGGGQSQLRLDKLLEAIDSEVRGQRVYRAGVEGPKPKVDSDRQEHDAGVYLDQMLSDAGEDPKSVDGKIRGRTVEIMLKEGEHDPLAAYERAIMEETYYGKDAAGNERIENHIPGWDVNDAGTAPAPGRDVAELGSQGERDTGRSSREVGEPDRAPAEGFRSQLTEDEAWKAMAHERLPEDEPAAIEASLHAQRMPEPASLEPSKRLSAALAAEKKADEFYRSMEPYIDEADKVKLNDGLALLAQQGKDIDAVVRQGAACLAAAGFGAV